MTNFEDNRAAAYRLLGEAADHLRGAGAPTKAQGKALRAAFGHIGRAKDALNRAAGRATS